MTVPDPKPFARELLIAQLAVQRASLATKLTSDNQPSSTAAHTPISPFRHHPHPQQDRASSQTTSLAHRSLAKADTSPVTVADYAAQALLVAAVHAAFPRDAVLGEEDADALRADPALAARGGQYAVSLALLEDGKEVLGVLGCPNLMPGVGGRVQERVCDRDGMGVMLAAVKGQGASWRPMGRGGLLPATRIDRGRGNAPVELRDVHFVDSSNSPATLTGKVRELAEITGALYPAPTELYSSHMRYAAMALGGREFVQLRWPKPGKGPWSIWDHAGSQLIYAESGAGKVTDLAGNPINFTTGEKLSKSWGLITADETIHGKILA
ncbi:ab7a68d7-080f-445c-9551-c26604f88bc5 [Thermothielavioides terrestris]|uniref:Ab7a68d7-080f-445c-9551-c26604f88bc5 n=1 Tax=Thermothielavioides terrestris TaxID=2587410 RepID=A0A446BPI7_9PEZI|nr:ab7a68d7-080f-445c-9551-c26604f88bc5 [Thermothielavioides terrestris]